MVEKWCDGGTSCWDNDSGASGGYNVLSFSSRIIHTKIMQKSNYGLVDVCVYFSLIGNMLVLYLFI